MNSEKIPFERMIFVCCNIRADGADRPACGARGAEKILESLKEEVKKRGLKGKVRALKSGCQDLCEKGPNVMIYPEGILQSAVTPEDVPALIDTYL